MGFLMVREPKEDALKPGGVSPDILTAASVPFDMRLPQGVCYLKVRISGLSTDGLALDGGRQRLSGDILEVFEEDLSRRDSPSSGGGAATTPAGRNERSEMESYLASNPFVQSDAPEIVALAKKIVRGNGSLIYVRERASAESAAAEAALAAFPASVYRQCLLDLNRFARHRNR